jgi:death-on-curing protein
LSYELALDAAVTSAALLLGVSDGDIRRLPNYPHLEAACAAPFASFGGEDAYPSLEDKAAVLCEHIARNHPLPDANKRTAFLATYIFLEASGLRFGDQNDADITMVERIAAGEAEHEEIVAWLKARTL